MEPRKNEFVNCQLKYGASIPVLEFIFNVLYHNGDSDEAAEHIRHLFRAGYCYYFAHMLKTGFKRGEVCWAAPFGHFVWVDDDGKPYDIEGLYFGEADEFIPESYLGDMIDDFLHVPGKVHNATEEEIQKCISRYRLEKAE